MTDFLDVCKRHNILIVVEELGAVCGFYSNMFGQPTMHVNVNKSDEQKNTIIKHLLIEGFLIDPLQTKFVRCEHVLNSDKAL
jgi:hypothetical protein